MKRMGKKMPCSRQFDSLTGSVISEEYSEYLQMPIDFRNWFQMTLDLTIMKE
jgi:hypothetical protein